MTPEHAREILKVLQNSYSPLSEKTFRALGPLEAEGEHPFFRDRLEEARNPLIPPERLEVLLNDPSDQVRAELARHPSLQGGAGPLPGPDGRSRSPGGAGGALRPDLPDYGGAGRGRPPASLCRHPALPEYLQLEILENHPERAGDLARNPSASPQLLEQLARSTQDPELLEAILYQDKARLSTLARIAEEALDPLTRSRALEVLEDRLQRLEYSLER